MNENELKEPEKWFSKSSDIINGKGRIASGYSSWSAATIAEAHNNSMDKLYKQAVALQDELDTIKRSVDFFPSYSESISNRVEAICFEYRRIHQVLTSSEHANNTASEIALARQGEAVQSTRARFLESKLKEADSTIEKLQLELAQLRQLIEQDAKARERQSEAEKKFCDHDWITIDASFDHEFGTEQVFYDKCQNCGRTKAVEPRSPEDE